MIFNRKRSDKSFAMRKFMAHDLNPYQTDHYYDG